MEPEFKDGGDDALPVPSAENPFRTFVGALPVFCSLEEINAWIRDLRDDDLEPGPPAI